MSWLAKSWSLFDYWFDRQGHWIYPSKAKAEEVWAYRGIDGLPDYVGKRPSSKDDV